jgi:hypothetical protein
MLGYVGVKMEYRSFEDDVIDVLVSVLVGLDSFTVFSILCYSILTHMCSALLEDTIHNTSARWQ